MESEPTSEPSEPTSWDRVRWPDDEPLPEPGHRIEIALRRDGRMHLRPHRVLGSRPDFEPGWIQVEVEPL